MANEVMVASAANARAMVAQVQPQMQALLPPDLPWERFAQIAVNCCAQTPALLRCTGHSFLQAIRQAAEVGIEPNGMLGLGYLIPYKTEAKFMLGYKGLVKLALEAGGIKTIRARCVHKDDAFECVEGFEQKLVHIPNWEGDRSDESVRLVYAVAEMRDGTKVYEIMTRTEVLAIQRSSRAGKDGPWVDHWQEMAKKTVVRRLCKMLNLSGSRWEKAQEIEHEDNESLPAARPADEPRTRRVRSLAGQTALQARVELPEPEVAEPPPTFAETEDLPPAKDPAIVQEARERLAADKAASNARREEVRARAKALDEERRQEVLQAAEGRREALERQMFAPPSKEALERESEPVEPEGVPEVGGDPEPPQNEISVASGEILPLPPPKGWHPGEGWQPVDQGRRDIAALVLRLHSAGVDTSRTLISDPNKLQPEYAEAVTKRLRALLTR